MTALARFPIGARYLVAGGLGFAISLVLYEVVYFINPLDDLRAPSSWGISYLMGVVVQHALHRRITFVDSAATYATSLKRSYVVYVVVLAATTVLDWVGTETFGWNHRIVWFSVLVIASVFSFFGLRRFAFPATLRS